MVPRPPADTGARAQSDLLSSAVAGGVSAEEIELAGRFPACSFTLGHERFVVPPAAAGTGVQVFADLPDAGGFHRAVRLPKVDSPLVPVEAEEVSPIGGYFHGRYGQVGLRPLCLHTAVVSMS